MSTWLNGGDAGGRREPKVATVAVSREEVSRAIVKSATIMREKKERTLSTAIVENFLDLLQDFGFHSGRHHKRYRPAPSLRTAALVLTEVRAFYRQRPRPWLSPNARARQMRIARRHAARALEWK